jgi:hypothetical protein
VTKPPDIKEIINKNRKTGRRRWLAIFDSRIAE